jgi:hypothetical protein
MGSRDRDVRNYAVPVRGAIWGHNYNDLTENNLQAGSWTSFNGGGHSDIAPFFFDYRIGFGSFESPTPAKICPIRILQSHFGEVVECFVDLRMVVASGDSDLTLKLAVGRFEPDSLNRVMNYTNEEIKQSWRIIRGSDTPLSVADGVIMADVINLLPAIPKYGDPEHREDAFVLILAFNKVPTITGDFKFEYLNIHNSVTGVL